MTLIQFRSSQTGEKAMTEAEQRQRIDDLNRATMLKDAENAHWRAHNPGKAMLRDFGIPAAAGAVLMAMTVVVMKLVG